MSTPILPFAVWASGTNQNSVPANDNALRAEILQRNINNATTAQPGSPSDGDTYIIQSTHTGAQWAGFTPKDLAIYKGGTWYAFAPVEGVKVTVGGALYVYTSGAWTAATGGGVSDGDKGDIVVSGSGAVWVLDFAGATGTFDVDGTLAANSDTRLATQKATKTYVDALLQGLSWKKAVRAATTTAGTLASSFENGDAIDGVTLATGDRILVKNQSSGTENGIYTVNASGAPTRATDADTGAELVNATVYVSEGTTQADTQWTQTANAPITIGSTALAFAQLSAGGSVAWGAITGTLASQADLAAALALKQARTPAEQAVSSASTVTPTFSDDAVVITAQAAALTLANPTGTAIPNLGISIRIKDNGTARAITYGTQYRAIGVTLPVTTVVSKTLYLGMIYNAADTKWDVVAVALEA